MWSQPLPPLKNLEGREKEREVEMKGLVTSTEEDKDEYFEDYFNIGNYTLQLPSCVYDAVRCICSDSSSGYS